jgi:hypothetical protein
VIAFLCLLPPTGGILALRGGLFSPTTLKLLARWAPEVVAAESKSKSEEFTGDIALEPLPPPGWRPTNQSDDVRVRLAEVEQLRTETWQRTAASRERVLRDANALLVVSFGLFVLGGWMLLVAQFPS